MRWTVSFEIATYALAAWVFWGIWRRRSVADLTLVLSAFAFVSLAEFIAIELGRKYYYGDFLLSFCSGGNVAQCTQPNSCVPVAVKLAEALLVFAVFRTTDCLSIPKKHKLWVDAGAVVTIDLALDPIVATSVWCGAAPHLTHVGLGLWTWMVKPAYPGLWFGIPLENYAAWTSVVLAFSWATRFFARNDANGGRSDVRVLSRVLLTIVTAFPLAAMTVAAIDVLLYVQPNESGRWLVGAVVLTMIYVTSAIVLARAVPLQRPRADIIAVQAFFYVFMLIGGLASGAFRSRPELAALWATCLIASLALGAVRHTQPVQHAPRT